MEKKTEKKTQIGFFFGILSFCTFTDRFLGSRYVGSCIEEF